MRFPSRCLVALLAIATLAAEDAPFAAPEQREWNWINEMHPYGDGVLGTASSVYFLSFESKAARHFTVGGMKKSFSVQPSGTGWIFFGYDGTKFMLAHQSATGEVRSIAMPEPLQNLLPLEIGAENFPDLVPGTRDAVLIHRNTVWWLTGEIWHSRKLPKTPQFHEEFEPGETIRGSNHPGNACYLLGNTLFVGWDRGEWGGMLASIDLAAESPEWIHLSGKKRGDATGIPANQPVAKIQSPNGKDLWVMSRCLHLGGEKAGLSRRSANGTWTNLLYGDHEERAVQFRDFPEEVNLQAMALDARERIHLLMLSEGIYRMDGKAMTLVVDHPSLESAIAQEFAITKGGDMFVSTRGDGIFALRKREEKWEARQILVAED